jgi:hypothetical protein
VNTVTILLASTAACSIIWYVITTLLIYENLRRRGQRVSFLWLRVLAPWYASRYKEITKRETGRVGILFYHWILSINLALVSALSAFIVHNL